MIMLVSAYGKCLLCHHRRGGCTFFSPSLHYAHEVSINLQISSVHNTADIKQYCNSWLTKLPPES